MNLPPLKKPSRMMPAVIVFSLLSGCGGVRVVTIPTTQPRQLAETVQAYVYVQTADGTRVKSSNRTPLFEGEWVLTDPGQ
jgi:hypothetical protein